MHTVQSLGQMIHPDMLRTADCHSGGSHTLYLCWLLYSWALSTTFSEQSFNGSNGLAAALLGITWDTDIFLSVLTACLHAFHSLVFLNPVFRSSQQPLYESTHISTSRPIYMQWTWAELLPQPAGRLFLLFPSYLHPLSADANSAWITECFSLPLTSKNSLNEKSKGEIGKKAYIP